MRLHSDRLFAPPTPDGCKEPCSTEPAPDDRRHLQGSNYGDLIQADCPMEDVAADAAAMAAQSDDERFLPAVAAAAELSTHEMLQNAAAVTDEDGNLKDQPPMYDD